jgi:hypothetical protein
MTPNHSVHCDAFVADPTFELAVRTSRGRHTIGVERLTSVASTYVPPHHEMAGTDLTRLEGAQMTKSAARFVLDGKVPGHGQLDRFCRIITLTNPGRA